ncbi:hypothetical protein [Candidatus Mesenet endosymbiont of Agriotes lineatus]|uniref:hypothetical protein n=1 Tax=Candidatus Mesenet endosymbiont of Agriotes lineatus TaxID=3077948 RepID=UPI0030CB21E9
MGLYKEELLEDKKTNSIGLVLFSTASIIVLSSAAMMGVVFFAKPSKASFITGAVGFVISSFILSAVTIFCAFMVYGAVLDLKKVNKSLKNIDYPEQESSKNKGV